MPSSQAGNIGPGGEGLGAAGPEAGRGFVVSAAREEVGELVMGDGLDAPDGIWWAKLTVSNCH
jgi:hypothetical protein